eukprot:jgi/Tetstr1/439683/TSEL_028102.t1
MGPPLGTTITAKTVVCFSRAHPEITGDHNLNANILTRTDVPDPRGILRGQDQSPTSRPAWSLPRSTVTSVSRTVAPLPVEATFVITATKIVDIPGKPGERCQVYASSWQDTQPMLLVHTSCSDALAPHADRLKSKYKDGKVTKILYTVDQRASHAMYRQHFNAIDIKNKMSIGPNTVAKGWAARNTVICFWLYCLAVIETNAYCAYTTLTNNANMSRHEWNVPWPMRSFRRARRSSAAVQQAPPPSPP